MGGDLLQGVINYYLSPAGPPEKSVPLPQPADFYTWIFVYINGERAVNPYEDVDPYIARSTGRTLVPIRFVTEALGGKAEWFEAERKVRLTWKDKYMEMTIGQTEAVANGRVVKLDQPPIIVSDRTVVPARAVAEAFGADVQYIDSMLRVSITLEGAECPKHICW